MDKVYARTNHHQLFKCLHFDIRKTLVTGFVLSFFCAIRMAMATDYYVSSQGNDTNSGTSSDKAWKTLEKVKDASKKFKPGDKIFFERGSVFAGSLTLAYLQGKEGAPIVFAAYGNGADPIFTGAVKVNNWVRHAGNIWKATCHDCPASLKGVYLDNVLLPLGRYPNTDAPNRGYLTIDKSHDFADNQIVIDSELSKKFADNYWKGADIVVRTRRWLLDIATIASHSGGVINLSQKITYGVKENYGYFIQNSYKTLDQDKEWYYDNATKTLYIYFDSINPNEYSIEVAKQANLLSISSSKFLTFQHISFEKSSGASIKVTGSGNITFSQNHIVNSGKNALFANGCNHFLFQENLIEHTNNNAIEYKGNKGKFIDNKIYNTAMVGGMGASGNGQYNAVDLYGNDILFQYNEVVNSGYLGIQFKGNSCLIKNNFVSGVCLVKDDGAGIYTFDNQGTNNKVIDNIVLYATGVPEGTDAPHYNTARGIYTDGGTSGVYLEGNTVAYSGGGIMLHVSRNITVLGNTLFKNEDHTMKVVYHPYTGRAETRDLLIKDNILYTGDINNMFYNLMSHTTSGKEFGVIDENILINPIQDVHPRTTYAMLLAENTKYPTGSSFAKSNFTYESLSLAPYGGHDRESPIFHQKYVVTDTLSDNLLKNSDFKATLSAKDWVKSPANSSIFKISNDNANPMDGTSLKAAFSSTVAGKKASIIQKGFALQGGEYYLISFDIKGSKQFILPFIIDIEGEDKIHAVKYFDVDTDTKRYTYIFQAKSTTNKGRINFELSTEHGITWFDNIKLHRVQVQETKEEDIVHLEFNASKQPKEIILDAHYVTPAGEKVSGKISVPPYGSVVLIKDISADTKEPGQETPEPSAPVAKGKIPWKEKFNLANNTIVNNGPTTWWIDTARMGIGGTYGVEKEILRFSKSEGAILWQSHPIDISAADMVTVSFDMKETGELEKENEMKDYLYVYYRIDNGGWQPVHLQEGNLAKDDTWYTFSADSLTGNVLELMMHGKTTVEGESYFVDNMLVDLYTGEGKDGEDEPVEHEDPDHEENDADDEIDYLDDIEDKDKVVEEDDEDEEGSKGAVVRIYAAGRSGKETMELLIDEKPVMSWHHIAGGFQERRFVQYVYRHADKITDPSRIRIAYTNDTDDLSDLRVDKLVLDGIVYETEAANIYSTGTNKNGSCDPGYKEDEVLHCSGYFQYAPRASDITGIDAGVTSNELMKIVAYPNPFTSSMEVKINGNITNQVTLKLMSAMGLTLYEAKHIVGYQPIVLDLANLKAGIYLLHVNDVNDKFQTFSVIKQ